MTIYGITYSSGNMDKSAGLCVESMNINGTNHPDFYFRESDIHRDFYWLYQDILSQPRGGGYWLWKPYLICKFIADTRDGEYIFWSDAGCEIINNLSHLVNAMDQDILFFTNTFKQVEWTKGDIMDRILPEWRDGRYDKAMQVQASNILFKVNDNTRRFVREWLAYCTMPGLIDDSPSISPNYPTFAENRHDQSILTALQIKYGYKLHWFPSTTAHHIKHYTPDDQYPVIIRHHRLRDHEWND